MSNSEHSFSTADIDQNLQQIKALLEQEELDHAELLALVNIRDKLVLEQLNQLDDEQKQLFGKAELATNQLLQSQAQSLYEQTEKQLAKLVRNRKVIKKYK
ncbi:hypothetical protein [Neptunicella sp. SCSIO 80796]|uniref:hypothetical protein n=1 Tax=Neptunicella plasticusilytica TaxID=3117012 RepID=UPI003A4DEA57